MIGFEEQAASNSDESDFLGRPTAALIAALSTAALAVAREFPQRQVPPRRGLPHPS